MIFLDNLTTCEIQAYGTVQGVGFRYGTLFIARSLGLSGWVKNMPDYSVLIHVKGNKHDIITFIDKLKKGPTPSARVTKLETTWDIEPPIQTDFTIIY